METVPNLETALEQIEAINKEGGEYLRLFLDMTGDYDVEPYLSNPELGFKCFTNGLDDDVNELIWLFSKDITDKSKTALAHAFRNLREMLSSKGFSLATLAPLFEHLIEPEENKTGESPNEKRPYHLANILFDRTEMERFFKACGFTADIKSGKGSHTKWFDPNGKFMLTTLESETLWLKNNIKALLEKGVSLETIKAACEKCGVQFTIMS